MLFNRDISWLGFNDRVLQEAANAAVPLIERIRFLSIFSSNLDEFSRVRYPVVLALTELKNKVKKKIVPEPDSDLARQVQHIITEQLTRFGAILYNDILPALSAAGIVLYYNQPIQEQHKQEMRDIFLSMVLSFIQPVHLEGNPSRLFAPVNGQLYFLVTLKNDTGLLHHYAVNIPSDKVNRFFELTPVEGKEYIAFIDDIIRENIHCLFPGFTIYGVYSIKINRDAELYLDEDYSGDVLDKIEKQLTKRDAGTPSRFLYERDMPLALKLFVSSAFGIRQEEQFEGGRYHNLSDLADLPVEKEQLQFPRFRPLLSGLIKDCGNIFKTIEESDILLHFPYESYNPILAFFNQAAIDTDVTHIYIALYRVAAGSHIVNALISAARNGKKVIVFVELKARFDEANNIRWSREMKKAGIRLIYSMPRVKVHSKIAMVIKEQQHQRKVYSVISTGNFNETTARFYTDHTLLTTNEVISTDLQELFFFLQRKEVMTVKSVHPKALLISGVNMTETFMALIDREIAIAKQGQQACIRIKLNNLEEQGMIEKLYEASKAGVRIQLMIRSICCLVPGVPGLSETITVRRIVDRFLEHSRIFIFGTNEASEVFIGSADWMTRNLHHRIEVCVPVQNRQLKEELIRYVELQWQDTDKATELGSNGEYHSVEDATNEKLNAQTAIQEYLKKKI
jgi:polyphosphate kinase